MYIYNYIIYYTYIILHNLSLVYLCDKLFFPVAIETLVKSEINFITNLDFV